MQKFASANEEQFEKIAVALDYPDWLTEALIIEYLPCRCFFERDVVVLFDFGRVQAADVKALPLPAAVFGNFMLFHNVTQDVIARRMLSGLAGMPMATATDPGLILPEGKVNHACVPWEQNPVTVWDWKLDPSERAFVIDHDGLYQWKVATFINQPEGWFTSAVYGVDNLAELRALQEKIVKGPLSPPYPTEPETVAATRAQLAALYNKLEQVRARMRTAVLAHHAVAKGRPEAMRGYTEDPPITLTVFDQLALVEGKLKVRSHIEPLLFRAAHRAAVRAGAARAATIAGALSAAKLAEEIEAAAEAITLSAMCLEAYVNGLILDHLPELVKEMERMEARAKWMLLPFLLGKRDCFDKSAMPYQAFAQLVGWRNELVHYKHEFANPIDATGQGRVSELHSVCNAANAQKAVEAVTLMVRQINGCLGTPDPDWGANASGWLNPL